MKRLTTFLICLVLVIILFSGTLTEITKEVSARWRWCTDSDGKNIYTKGYAQRGRTRLWDKCYDTNRLYEAYCRRWPFYPRYSKIRCPTGFACKDGACIKKTPTEPVKPTCIETAWKPPASAICAGETTTQRGNCGTIRSVTGTKTCESGYKCENGVCKEEKQPIDMLIFISPQYSKDSQILASINSYTIAVKNDIDWNIKIIKLDQSTNTIGKIREIIKSYYLNNRTKAVLMMGEDIKTQLGTEYGNINNPTTILWEELDEPLIFLVVELKDSRWQGINIIENGIITGVVQHQISPESTAEEIDSLFPHFNNDTNRILQLSYTYIPKPDVFVSLLYPPKEYSYNERVNKIIFALNKFTQRTNQDYGNLIQAYTFVKEDSGIEKSSIIDYNAFTQLGKLNQIKDYVDSCFFYFDFDKEYKLFIADGHGLPIGISVSAHCFLNAMEIGKLKTPFFLGYGCNIGGWYSDSNPNAILDVISKNNPIDPNIKGVTAEQIFNSAYLEIMMLGGTGSFNQEYFSGFVSALNSGKTVAEAHNSVKRYHGNVFYGDPTFSFS